MMDFSIAKLCLFDPARHNIMVTRASLVEIGFADIELVTDFAKFSEMVAKVSFDLIIAESHDAGGAVSDLMKKIRVGEIGINPFVVTVTTSWERDTTHVLGLVNAGIDDILLRPFSTEQLRSRVNALTNSRKEFVVTSDYVGPDRRNEEARKSSPAQTFAPPNTLKATVTGDEEAKRATENEIKVMKLNVAKERVKRLAMKIVVSMQVMIDDPVAGAKLDMEEIDAVARELRRRLRGQGVPDAVEMATALTDLTTELVDPVDDDASQYKLVRELALGTFMAYSGGNEMNKDSTEIKKTVESLRKKLHSRKISD